jgi:hypothetical protein
VAIARITRADTGLGPGPSSRRSVAARGCMEGL